MFCYLHKQNNRCSVVNHQHAEKRDVTTYRSHCVSVISVIYLVMCELKR